MTPNEVRALLPYLTPQERAEMDSLLVEEADPLEGLKRNPALIMTWAGLYPDPWQAKLLRQPVDQLLLLCSRQAGKSTTAAALALRQALFCPESLILVLSPTLRQSGEFFRRKVLTNWRGLGCPFKARSPTQLELELSNGSRIVSLPESEEGIRGFSSVSMLIIDEASRVDDALYNAVTPMLAVTNGKLLALSTPFGQRGWFFDEWDKGIGWEKVKVTASECPRITPAFLAKERAKKGDRWFAQEYFCSFESAVDQVFSPEVIRRAVRPDIAPLW